MTAVKKFNSWGLSAAVATVAFGLFAVTAQAQTPPPAAAPAPAAKTAPPAAAPVVKTPAAAAKPAATAPAKKKAAAKGDKEKVKHDDNKPASEEAAEVKTSGPKKQAFWKRAFAADEKGNMNEEPRNRQKEIDKSAPGSAVRRIGES
jgi:hypothetical protein